MCRFTSGLATVDITGPHPVVMECVDELGDVEHIAVLDKTEFWRH